MNFVSEPSEVVLRSPHCQHPTRWGNDNLRYDDSLQLRQKHIIRGYMEVLWGITHWYGCHFFRGITHWYNREVATYWAYFCPGIPGINRLCLWTFHLNFQEWFNLDMDIEGLKTIFLGNPLNVPLAETKAFGANRSRRPPCSILWWTFCGNETFKLIYPPEV